MKKLVCVSGSPIKNSNTDRMLKNIGDNTGCEYEFIKLSDKMVRPCLACKACVTTNKCIQNDDFQEISELILAADAVIFGTYTPYGMIDAFSKAFFERLWSMRHMNSLNSGKFAITVVTSLNRDVAEQVNREIAMEMVMEGFVLLDQFVINGSVPCLSCGYGDGCQNSFARMQVGEKGLVADTNCFDVENQRVFEKGSELGKILGSYLKDEQLFDREKHQKNIAAMMETMMPMMDKGIRQWREEELAKVNRHTKTS
ncbi:flavodoxin family protein [Acetobacterium woodii]|uniref:Iron-sulfur flavoprotein n=1 Tax=Acetobacterium woodii (strain ATCC 29683 / DSM 1030 / JCM 2381 / KCTC 1655 / WB1) TaxID=931626 RepID=H6LFN2_ACEWD|nr:flavodoxin family protein [Acetobacterium woodii]AFA46977.1 iron-sulfur flavoprotein [Acetobacterium woodii DSM 1030]